MFPKIAKMLDTSGMRPALGYAIVENGRLVATDAHKLVCIPVHSFIKDEVNGDTKYTAEEQISNIEGKLFSPELVKELTATSIVKTIYLEDYILTYNKKGVFNRLRYAGKILTPEERADTKKFDTMAVSGNAYRLIDPFSGGDLMKNDRVACINYPRWQGVVPVFNPSQNQIDFAALEEGLAITHTVTTNIKQLQEVGQALGYDNVAIIPHRADFNIIVNMQGSKLDDTQARGFGLIMAVKVKNLMFF